VRYNVFSRSAVAIPGERYGQEREKIM
jgi:hypothetical protein